MPRPDALAKVTGAARYPADLVRPGMLHAAAVFAHRAHARILNVDAAEALALPGVRAVLTAQDVPYNRFGLIVADQPLLCEDVVRFYGDRVALVVADSAAAARAAATRVKVAYEDLPAVTSAQASPLFPGLPSIAEAGLPGYEALTVDAVVVPAKTPAAIIKRLLDFARDKPPEKKFADLIQVIENTTLERTSRIIPATRNALSVITGRT